MLYDKCSLQLFPVVGDDQGHSQYDIPEEQLQFLVGINFHVPAIARILGVAESTVRRRMNAYGLSIRGEYSGITDLALDDAVRSIKLEHPHSGYRMVMGFLNTRGLRLQESRVRCSLRRVDPLGVASRWSRNRAINRWRYCVPHPNAVWHLDGNMKLVRWGFVVHGGSTGTLGWSHSCRVLLATQLIRFCRNFWELVRNLDSHHVFGLTTEERIMM